MLNIFVFFVLCVICNMKKYREAENIVSLVQPVHQQWPHLRHMTEQLKLGHISSCHTNFPLRCQLMILKGEWMNHWERIHLNKGNVMALPVQTEVTQCLKKMLVAGKTRRCFKSQQHFYTAEHRTQRYSFTPGFISGACWVMLNYT